MSSADKVRRWRNILAELRPHLPGDWSVRGTGPDTMLIREPVDWALTWIGFFDSPTSSDSWVAAGVQPLVVPFTSLVMTYGISMNEVRSGPPAIDLLADDADEHVRQFVLGAGLEKIDGWPAERLADVAERDFAQDPRRRRTHWHQLPGWRVVNGTASPAEPAEQLVTRYRELAGGSSKRGARQLLKHVEFYELLRDVWNDGGRDDALKFLVEHRDRDLVAQKLDTASAA